jgi:hypothetical protein
MLGVTAVPARPHRLGCARRRDPAAGFAAGAVSSPSSPSSSSAAGRDPIRYLIGVFVFLPMLLIEGTIGTLDLIRLLWKWHRPGRTSPGDRRGAGLPPRRRHLRACRRIRALGPDLLHIVIIAGLGLAASVALNHRVSA